MKIPIITGTLYRLDFPNGKSYIGASTSPSKERYREHQNDALRGSMQLLHKAWRELGDPILVILEIRVPAEKLWLLEKEAIVKYKTRSPNGYNAILGFGTPPGPLGKKPSLQHRKKLSLAQQHRFKKPKEHEKLSLAALKRYENPKEREKARERERLKKLSKQHERKEQPK